MQTPFKCRNVDQSGYSTQSYVGIIDSIHVYERFLAFFGLICVSTIVFVLCVIDVYKVLLTLAALIRLTRRMPRQVRVAVSVRLCRFSSSLNSYESFSSSARLRV